MGFIVRDCHRCGTSSVQLTVLGSTAVDSLNAEVFVVCNACGRSSIYKGRPNGDLDQNRDISLHVYFANRPIQVRPKGPKLSEDIPERTRGLFDQAADCRRYGLVEAAGAMFRKTIDVGTKELYQIHKLLEGKAPALALRSRIRALGELSILEQDIVELADIAALDGNDAVHDIDPYTPQEAEALEELTLDLLDRLFVRPAKIERVRAKQIDSGLRDPD